MSPQNWWFTQPSGWSSNSATGLTSLPNWRRWPRYPTISRECSNPLPMVYDLMQHCWHFVFNGIVRGQVIMLRFSPQTLAWLAWSKGVDANSTSLTSEYQLLSVHLHLHFHFFGRAIVLCFMVALIIVAFPGLQLAAFSGLLLMDT